MQLELRSHSLFKALDLISATGIKRPSLQQDAPDTTRCRHALPLAVGDLRNTDLVGGATACLSYMTECKLPVSCGLVRKKCHSAVLAIQSYPRLNDSIIGFK